MEAENNGGVYLRPHPTFKNGPVLRESIERWVRDAVVATCRCLLQKLAVKIFSPRMCRKLMKDVPKSAMRKCERLVG